MESNWRRNKILDSADGMCVWPETLGLNIPQIWILSRFKLCSKVQVEQHQYLDSQGSRHVKSPEFQAKVRKFPHSPVKQSPSLSEQP